MNAEVKEKWIKALKSGEYKQTTESLRDSTGFCCLGVLCDLHSKEFGILWDINKDYPDFCTYYDNEDILPKAVAHWAGISCDPLVGDGFKSLSAINDDGESFETIAKLIEENL